MRRLMAFPSTRFRRLRRGEAIRRIVRETRLDPADLVQPLFVVEGEGIDRPIPGFPGQRHLSPDVLAEEALAVASAGCAGVLLFGLPDRKDAEGSSAWDDDGVVQRGVRAIRARAPELPVITDVCLCQYTDHGACGVLGTHGDVDNDATIELLARIAVSHAEAGAAFVAPSDMMDGRVGAIRTALDDADLVETGLISYSAKYASAFYGPFRGAVDSAPKTGDRRGHQIDPANGREGVRESLADLDEGADMLMVKPAGPYLDVIARLCDTTLAPVAAYQVSGEHGMLEAAAAAGALEREAAILESLIAIRRAGATLIATYFAREVAGWLR
jgi:porphobilinogen synthase